MKSLLLIPSLLLVFIHYANAGCGISFNTPNQASGNFTYDSVTNTYYIHQGDTLHYLHGTVYHGVSAGNWCLLNDSDYAQTVNLDITLAGKYTFYGECFGGSGTEGVYLGSIKVAYISPNNIEELNTKETCSAFYSSSSQNITISYSNMYRQRITYSLYNLSGQQILHGGFTPNAGANQEYKIDLSGKLSGEGMCIMVMETLGNTYTNKMVY